MATAKKRVKKNVTAKNKNALPVLPISSAGLAAWLKQQPETTQRWIRHTGFTAEPQSFCLIPGKSGKIERVLAGVTEPLNLWAIAHLPAQLPNGNYRIEGTLSKEDAAILALGWELGCYRFNDFVKPDKKAFATLELPAGCDRANIQPIAESVHLARDLINSPANVMGPEALAKACKQLAKQHQASCRVVVGDALLKQNYPAIHAVGRACEQAPRLADLRWGNEKHPKVTLVGKGVTFDTGGLDIKPSSGMLLMKKDMGGAACVLALANMVMTSGLPVRLRVLVPIVENSIAGNAYRPSDIIATRKGLSVEVGNTDAEGRLILCDALAEADQEAPDLLIDMATLTGASRVALGTDIPSFFTADDNLADALQHCATSVSDPLWRLPLWQDYREQLNSPVADINSAPGGGYAGAITAALFLKEFVTNSPRWLHVDLMAWNLRDRPGRPAGGEAQAIRGIFALLQSRYGKKSKRRAA